ncbi:MAG: hypothetical protein WBB45_06280 [Cyclobacteriaceae bacterium]
METRTLEKNGKKVEYFIDDNDHVIVRDPETKDVVNKVSIKQNDDSGTVNAEGLDEFRTCMAGCYDLKQGSPWEFAACIAECSTLIPI